MKAVIFDRDGIIINSESINIDAVERAFQKYGIQISEDDKRFIIGKHPNDYGNYFLNKYDYPVKELFKIQKKFYYEMIESAPVFEETIKLIKRLKEQNISLALTTSSDRESTLNILKKNNLDNIFDVIVTFDECSKRKPEPEPYQITARKLDIDPNECIVIEDSSIGVESAKYAGMKCIAIPNEFTRIQDFSKADLIVNSASEITLETLDKLWS